MKDTHKFWDESVEYYDEAESTGTPLSSNPALQKLFDNIKPYDKVLDVGCGEGSKIRDAYSRVPDIEAYGVDISGLALGRATEKHPDICFLPSDIEELEFVNDYFDVVYSTYVFEHTTNPLGVLREMIRVTKPGGKVIIVCPNYGSPIYTSPITPKFN